MELSPSRMAASCAATQEFPSIFLNPKVNYSAHKSPQLVPILNQINSVHYNPSYLSKIQHNISLTHLRFGLLSDFFYLTFT
jgi:hypothetical protein